MAINVTVGGVGNQQNFIDSNFSGGPNATNWSDPDLGIIALAKKTAEHVAASFTGQSNNTLTVGTGSKTFTTDILRAYHFVGCLVKIHAVNDSSAWMKGTVTATDATSGSLTVDVNLTNGSGTFTSWYIDLDIAGQYTASEAAASLAEEWATKTGSVVADGEYSSKEYAVGNAVGSSKLWATKTGSVVTDGEYSAKEYAVGTAVASAKLWASKAENSVVEDGKYSALHYAAKAEGSATEAENSATIAQDSAASAGAVSRLAWSLISANTTVSVNNRYLANSENGTFTVTLPSSPVDNDFVAIADGWDFATNKVIVSASGGKTIAYGDTSIDLTVANIFVFFVFGDNTWHVVIPGVGFPVVGSAQQADPTLTALAALNATPGVIEQLGQDSFTKRAIGAGANNVLSLDGLGRLPAVDGSQLTKVRAIFYEERSSNTEIVEADNSKCINYTSGTFTQTIIDAASLWSGWFIVLKNSGSGVITIDPSGSQTIDGATTFTLYPGQVIILQCNGSNFFSVISTNPGVAVQTSNANVYASGTFLFDCTATDKTATLPASPSIGTTIFIGKFGIVGQLTIARNGRLIKGVADDGFVPKEYTGLFAFSYTGDTYGWSC